MTEGMIKEADLAKLPQMQRMGRVSDEGTSEFVRKQVDPDGVSMKMVVASEEGAAAYGNFPIGPEGPSRVVVGANPEEKREAVSPKPDARPGSEHDTRIPFKGENSAAYREDGNGPQPALIVGRMHAKTLKSSDAEDMKLYEDVMQKHAEGLWYIFKDIPNWDPKENVMHVFLVWGEKVRVLKKPLE